MAGIAANQYGKALFEAAKGQGKEQELYQEAGNLLEVWENTPALSSFLNDRGTAEEDKKAFLKSLFQDRLSSLLFSFLMVMQDHGRTSEIPESLKVFRHLKEKAAGTGKALVYSAVELNAGQKRKLSSGLLSMTGLKDCRIQYEVKPELLGGLVIKVGDRVLDGSMKTQFQELKKRLLAEKGGSFL